VHPAQAAAFTVYADETQVAVRWIPSIAGQWLEIATLIPAAFITGDQTDIRIVPEGVYMPYRHWVYQGDFERGQPDQNPVAAFGGVALEKIDVRRDGTRLEIQIDGYSDGSASGDAVLFVHVYDDVNMPPIAQASDRRLMGNTLPPGNLLPGAFSDTFVVDLTQAGQIAIGFYDPVTGERVMPAALDDSVSVDANSQRLFISEANR
jgi:hypothetical protein